VAINRCGAIEHVGKVEVQDDKRPASSMGISRSVPVCTCVHYSGQLDPSQQQPAALIAASAYSLAGALQSAGRRCMTPLPCFQIERMQIWFNFLSSGCCVIGHGLNLRPPRYHHLMWTLRVVELVFSYLHTMHSSLWMFLFLKLIEMIWVTPCMRNKVTWGPQRHGLSSGLHNAPPPKNIRTLLPSSIWGNLICTLDAKKSNWQIFVVQTQTSEASS
jgi:hypothetical protein